jgi:rfaE bifunctional protein nucleotidyltransferase chain/domain
MFSKKIFTLKALSQQISRWRLKSDTIVFTNGCFDLLHTGHLHTLQEAKKLGDKLVVGVNATSSVQKLKGPNRPIQSEEDRSSMLSALQMVDAVILFEEETPIKIIEEISPDILVKGGDWKIENIVGANYVLSLGGDVKSIPLLEGYSTTDLIKKIKEKG